MTTTHCVVELIKLGVSPEDEPFVLLNRNYHFVNLE